MIPKKNWIEQYIDYAEQITDAPRIFHKFVALTVLGSAMGNRWRIPNHEGGFDHANLWTMLIAKSSKLRKSTSAKIGLRIAHQADIPYIPAYGSTEAMAQLLIKTPHGLIYADEFDQFLRGIGRDYAAGRGFFASLYDGIVAPQGFIGREAKGSFDVAASFLSCTTMAWLTDQMKESDIEGGLLPRFLMIPAWKSDREPMDLPPTAHDEETKQKLVYGLHFIGGQDHICHPSPGAELVYKAWKKRLGSMGFDGTRGEAWPERVATTCHKMSMIYLASKKDAGNHGIITEQDMMNACDTCTEVLQNMKYILNDELAITKVEKDLQALRRVLEKYGDEEGWVSHSVALRYCHMDARYFQTVLATAMQSEVVELGKSRRGFPPIRLIPKEPGDER